MFLASKAPISLMLVTNNLAVILVVNVRDFARIDFARPAPYLPARPRECVMKIVNSLKSLKKRDKNCRIVRRKGRVFVINKINPRYKARQG